MPRRPWIPARLGRDAPGTTGRWLKYLSPRDSAFHSRDVLLAPLFVTFLHRVVVTDTTWLDADMLLPTELLTVLFLATATITNALPRRRPRLANVSSANICL